MFEDASGRDLGQFKRWYEQAGTPRVTVTEGWEDGRYTLELEQATPPTPGQPEKAPLVIPVAYGLIGADGATLAEGVLELDEPRQSVSWELPSRPVPSLLRGFSAPVILERQAPAAERAFLLAHDGDPFNKWEAGTELALDALTRLADDAGAGVDPDHLAALVAVADDADLDPAFKALALGLPSEEEVIAHVAARGRAPEPLAIHRARHALIAAIAARSGTGWERLYAANAVPGPYSPDAADAGRRALRARALGLLTALDPEAGAARAQFDGADNMTERMAALGLLVAYGQGDAALAAFHADWAHDRLVVDKWFAVQGALTPPEAAVETVERLTRAPGLRLEEPEPLPLADRQLRRRQPGRLPPGGRRRLPAVRRLADPARSAEPADHGADGGELRELADVRSRPAAADPRRARAAGGAAGAVARHRRDRRQVAARGTRLRGSRLSRGYQAATI